MSDLTARIDALVARAPEVRRAGRFAVDALPLLAEASAFLSALQAERDTLRSEAREVLATHENVWLFVAAIASTEDTKA
jgi:hypothetical protein